MEYDDIIKILAPWRGLNCAKCMAFINGDIKKTATELQRLLGAFDSYAERFPASIRFLKIIHPSKKLLAHFTDADCKGCRMGDCVYPNCGVTTCYRDKGVDFCFQCPEFPL